MSRRKQRLPAILWRTPRPRSAADDCSATPAMASTPAAALLRFEFRGRIPAIRIGDFVAGAGSPEVRYRLFPRPASIK